MTDCSTKYSDYAQCSTAKITKPVASYLAEATGSEQPFHFKRFNEFVIRYPENCSFLVNTSIGEIRLKNQCFDGVFCSGKFDCDICSLEIFMTENNSCHSNQECLSKLSVFVRHN